MLNSFACVIANLVCDFAFLKSFHAFLCLPDKWEGEPCGSQLAHSMEFMLVFLVLLSLDYMA